MDVRSRDYWKKPLIFVELVDAVEYTPDDILVPPNLQIFMEPPEDEYITDEESGDEENCVANRMNKAQLNVAVEIEFDDDVVVSNANEQQEYDCGDEGKIKLNWAAGDEDDLPLSSFMYEYQAKTWHESKCSPLTFGPETEPIEYFKLFFDNEITNSIAEETVKYAGKYKNKNITVEQDDIYAFFGVVIVSGYNELPRKRMYWENEEDVNNELISKWMRRGLFEDIFSSIHFIDNELTIGSNDRFVKMRPLVIYLNSVFSKYGQAEMNISIDESMIPYYGRHPCKQIIRNKPIRFGYKAWVAAARLGYCYFFDLYQGRHEIRDKNVGLGESVVMNFANQVKKAYPGQQFSLYFDNFFTSPSLLKSLNKIIYARTGTVRENRLQNKEFKTNKNEIKKQQREYHENFVEPINNLILTRWKDNQVVSVLSNTFGVNPKGQAHRYVHSKGKKIDIPQPHVIKMYNINMGGVDLMDAHIAAYRISMRGKKWYMPVIMWMVDLAVTNAWNLARKYGYEGDQLQFRRRLAKSLLLNHGKPPARGKSKKNSDFLSKGAHIAVHSGRKLPCKQCPSTTVFKCKTCNVTLHPKCFEQYHNKLK